MAAPAVGCKEVVSGGGAMRNRFVALLFVVGVLAACLLAPLPAAGQAASKPANPWTPPRTPDGQPNIQGYWRQRGDLTTYSIQAAEEDRAEHVIVTGLRVEKGRP